MKFKYKTSEILVYRNSRQRLAVSRKEPEWRRNGLCLLGVILSFLTALPTWAAPSFEMELLRFPSKLKAGGQSCLTARFTLDQPLETDSNVWVGFSQQDRLHFVSEFHPKTSVRNWIPGKEYSLKIPFEIPADIHSGTYEMQIGLHTLASQSPNCFAVEIKSATPTRTRPTLSHGVFSDRDGIPHRWYVNETNTLMWDGAPHLPVGGMFVPRSVGSEPVASDEKDASFQADEAIIDLIQSYGVRDLYLHYGTGPNCHPSRMQRLIDRLESKQMRYGIEFGEDPGEGLRYLLRSENAAVENITKPGIHEIREQGWVGGLYLVLTADGQFVSAGEAIKTPKGLAAEVVSCSPESPVSLFFVPRVRRGGHFWDGIYAQYETRVISYLQSLRFGSGFRFIVDPFMNEMTIPYDAIPDSGEFRSGFARWLLERYATEEGLKEAWALHEVISFEQASSLVPLRVSSDSRGIGFLYSLSSQKVVTADMSTSQLWHDFVEYHATSVRTACNRIARAIKSVADVPVVLKHHPQVDSYRINDTEGIGFDGIGMESYGSGELLKMFNASGAYAEAAQSAKTMWLVVTETSQGAYQHQNPRIAYQDRLGMYADFSRLLESGAKGIYLFGLYFGAPGQWRTTEIIGDPQQLEWIATYRGLVERRADRITTYQPQYYYWYPGRRSPKEVFEGQGRSHIGINGNWGGYLSNRGIQGLMKAQDGTWIVPTFKTDVGTDLLFVNLESPAAALRWGRDLDEVLRTASQDVVYMGFRRETGAIAYLDVYFTDDFDTADDGTRFQVLRPLGDCEVFGRNSAGKVWGLKTARCRIISKEIPDREGWMPADVPGLDKTKHQPFNFFEDILQARVLRLGDLWQGFTFERDQRPVVYLWPRGEIASVKMHFPFLSRVSVQYPDGEHVPGPQRKRRLDAMLVSPKWVLINTPQRGVEGPHVDSFTVRHVLVVEGASPGLFERACTGQSPPPEDVVLIEAENPQGSNFNFGRMDGLPQLSKQAFHLLESFVPPSPDTGYFSQYVFSVSRKGLYSLWVRERYLLFQSPCVWRVDGGDWQTTPSTIVPTRSETGLLWNLFDDDAGMFGWYKYAELNLAKGDHLLEFRVDKPRSEDGKYCKGMDLISLLKDNQPRLSLKEFQQPLNLLMNPSFEQGQNSNVEGWELMNPTGGQGTVEVRRNERGPKRVARCGHRCVLVTGAKGLVGKQLGTDPHPHLRSKPFEIKPATSYNLNAWISGSGNDEKAYLGVRFYNEAGKHVDAMSRQMPTVAGGYCPVFLAVRSPEAARFAVVQIGYQGENHVALDDIEFYESGW